MKQRRAKIIYGGGWSTKYPQMRFFDMHRSISPKSEVPASTRKWTTIRMQRPIMKYPQVPAPRRENLLFSGGDFLKEWCFVGELELGFWPESYIEGLTSIEGPGLSSNGFFPYY